MENFLEWIRRGALVLGIGGALFATPLARGGLPAPVASPAGGVFLSNATVSLSLTGAVGAIRVTMDGSMPGTNSPLYTVALAITNTTLVQARAFGTNGDAGELLAETYVLAETNLADFTSNLPLVILNTFGRAIAPGTNTPASVRVIAPGTGGRALLAGAADFDGRAAVKGRGYTSLRYPKRSFGLETRTASGEALEAGLLGLPKDADWILYAPYPDKTLLRDVLAYELSNKLGRYASRTRFVEVFVNDGAGRLDRSNYAGVYVLEEKVKRAPHRVAIQKLSPEDKAEPAITGGYIFKKDHLEEAGGEGAAEAPGRTKTAGWQLGLPSGPGGFPAEPAAFAHLAVPSVVSNAISIVTNLVTATNTVGSNTVVGPAWEVTIVGPHTFVVTNMVSVTNTSVATNLVVTTNSVVATNVAVNTTPVLVTNALVAQQAVAGTNAVATTNTVDAVTAVITTTTSIITTTTYRTNFVPATNLVSTTNISFATNLVAHTNAVIITNMAVAAVPVYATNRVVVTNVLVFGPPAPSPYVERLVASGEGFVTRQTNAFFFSEPKPAKLTAEQKAWLKKHLDQFEAALHGPDFKNSTNGYAAYLDVDSFIDHHLFVEATKNIDGFRFSTFFTKDRGAKLKMEPIWDWNLSFGNAKGKQGHLWDRWYWHQLDDQQYSWFRRLFEDANFAQRYVDRWAEWRTNVFATAAVCGRIDEMAAQLKEAAARNFARWPILGDQVGPEHYAGKTWEEDLAYLKTWITNRLAWMDGQFVAPPAASIPGGVICPTNVVALTAPAGKVFYTLDGTDPRGADGAVSPAAKPSEGPIALPASATMKSRTLKDTRWSPPVTWRFIVKPVGSGAGG